MTATSWSIYDMSDGCTLFIYLGKWPFLLTVTYITHTKRNSRREPFSRDNQDVSLFNLFVVSCQHECTSQSSLTETIRITHQGFRCWAFIPNLVSCVGPRHLLCLAVAGEGLVYTPLFDLLMQIIISSLSRSWFSE